MGSINLTRDTKRCSNSALPGREARPRLACRRFPACGPLARRPGGRAPADAGEDSFLACQAARNLECIVVLDLDYFVDDLQVQDTGNEPGADTLNLVAARPDFLAFPFWVMTGLATGSTAMALN